jgi:hypothetical protein
LPSDSKSSADAVEGRSPLLGAPYTIEYLDCTGRLSAGNSAQLAAANRGEKSNISLVLRLTTDLEKGSHQLGLFEITESTLMSYETFEIGLVDDSEIQFEKKSSNSDRLNVLGRIVKGTGYLEILWDFAVGKESKFLWRGKCQKVNDPILSSVKIAVGKSAR